jgi:hypothetical protein
MRGLFHDALAGARDVLGGVAGEIKQGHTLTDDEMLARYVNLHRGNPLATAQFVARNAPAGASPLAEWRRYEAQMEDKLKQRGMR